MRKKLFTFLFALLASVGMMNAKVTWKSCYISDLEVYGTYESYSMDGVTLSANADHIIARWEGYGDESYDGIRFMTDETGGFTFSNTLGKNFTKIEMTLNGYGGWDMVNLGNGWNVVGDHWNGMKAIWTGNASTVDLLEDESHFHGENVKRIVFYFEGDSEEPDPTYTVALRDGTANADKVTLSATSAEECTTVTVTPNEECEITEFSATYVVVEDQLGSMYEIDATLNPETGAYSFKMPAADVTIDATIALKVVPEGDIFAGFTATAGSGGFDNEGSANLVDNKFISSDWTKWCTNFDHMSVPTGESGDACWWIDFEASEALNPTGYILTTGNDTGNEHGRNPKNWVLKAKLNADDAWTTIATVTNDVTMKNLSFKDYKFFVDQQGSYKYFRFEVFANQGATVMQLCELRLIGTETPEPVVVTAYTLQLHVNDAAMGSVALQNPSNDIVDNGDGTYAVPEGASVTLIATPNEGYEFIGWKASSSICDFNECEFVDLPTKNNPLTFDMNNEVAFMAEFAAVTPQPQPAGNVVIWNMSMDAVNGIVDQNETKEVFGGITIAAGAKRAFMKNGNANALLFAFSSNTQEGFKGFTFANTLGVNFKKIVLSGAAGTFDGKESTGWVINDDQSTITWEGDAASVSIWETLNFIGPIPVNEVEFTLEGGDPAPTTAVEIGDSNNAEDVTDFLSTYAGQTVPDLTINRPVLNNMYNTLCLPFNMDADQIAASSLNGVEIYEFVDADVTNDELYLYTSEEKHEIVAGRPYLVKFSAASQLDNLDFVNVKINNADLDDQAVTIKGVTFKGTFQPIVLGAQEGLDFNGGHLFLMANNTLMWPNTDNALKPFRAYFTVNVDAGQSAGMPVRRGMPAHIGGPAQIPTGVDQISQEPMANSQKLMENGVLYIIKNGVKYNAQGQVVK